MNTPVADLPAALAAAQAVLDDARAKRCRLQNKITTATEALDEAERARQRLADEIDNGGHPSKAVHKASNAALTDAKAELDLLASRMGARDAEVAAASKEVAALTARSEFEEFRAVVRQRVEAAGALDRAAEALGAAFNAFTASGETLMAAWPRGYVLASHEIKLLRDQRAAAYILPKTLQTLIVQIGSVNTVPSLEARERATWGTRFGVN